MHTNNCENENSTNKLLIVFNDHAKGMLLQRKLDQLKNLKRNKDFKVILLEYILNCGDISNVPFSTAEIYEDLYFTNVQKTYENILASLNEIFLYDKNATIELFINLNNSNELCNLYYFAEKFKNTENVFLNYYHEQIFEIYHKSINDNVLDCKIVIDKRVSLTNKLISDFINKWQKLLTTNSAVRECHNHNIKEYSLKEAKEKVLPVFRNEYIKFPLLYSNFLDKYPDEKFDYTTFEYIVKKLIEEGSVERTYDVNTESGCCDIYFEQKFRLKCKND